MKVMMISKNSQGQVVSKGFVSSKKSARSATDKRDNKYGCYLQHFIICPVSGSEVQRALFNWS